MGWRVAHWWGAAQWGDEWRWWCGGHCGETSKWHYAAASRSGMTLGRVDESVGREEEGLRHLDCTQP